jgi:hypothetical protein
VRTLLVGGRHSSSATSLSPAWTELGCHSANAARGRQPICRLSRTQLVRYRDSIGRLPEGLIVYLQHDLADGCKFHSQPLAATSVLGMPISAYSGRSVKVRITHRSPFIKGCCIDLSRAAATRSGWGALRG